MHASRALRRRGPEDQPAHQSWPGQGDLLGDEAADRESQEIGPVEPHRGQEGNSVTGHLPDGVRRGPARAADAGVVECHNAAGRCQRVDQRGIPVVEISAEMLEQYQRHPARPSVAIRVIDAVPGTDQLVGEP